MLFFQLRRTDTVKVIIKIEQLLYDALHKQNERSEIKTKRTFLTSVDAAWAWCGGCGKHMLRILDETNALFPLESMPVAKNVSEIATNDVEMEEENKKKIFKAPQNGLGYCYSEIIW